MNRHLGVLLAFVAGSVNAGGFLAVGQYTSHVTGMLSSLADQAVLRNWALVMAAGASVLMFAAGAASTAILVNWARRRRLASEFAWPLLVEAVLLLVFGVLGARLGHLSSIAGPVTVLLLCYTMGLQNALITKVSRAEIRTTHMTGIVTDLGIELGKAAYWNKSQAMQPVRADRDRLRLMAMLLSSFMFGALSGAWAFSAVGYGWTCVLALILVAIAAAPLADDLTQAE